MFRKKIFIAVLSFFAALSFCADFDVLERDVKNYRKCGYRVQSLGEDYCIGAQGLVKEIDYKYAFCICGRGFFVLQKDDKEILFTRNGFFRVNGSGFLVSREGYLVLGAGSDIQNKKYEYVSSSLVKDRKNAGAGGIKRAGSGEGSAIDYFLIMEPKGITGFYGDCISAGEAVRIKTRIQQYAREAFPLSFEQLLDLTLEAFEGTAKGEYAEKKRTIVCLLEYEKEIIFNEWIFDEKDRQLFEAKLQKIRNGI